MATKKKAGRKPIKDKAVRFIIYPRESQLKLVGVEKAKEVALAAIEKEALFAAKIKALRAELKKSKK